MDMEIGDPWGRIQRNGGYSPEFLKRVQEKRKAGQERVARAAVKRRDEARLRAVAARREVAQRREREAAAAEIRRRGIPSWLAEIIEAAALLHGCSVTDILFRRRRVRAVAARHEAMYLTKQHSPQLSCPRIARWFECDHTTILFGMAKHAGLHGLEPLTKFNLPRKRSLQHKGGEAHD